MAYIGASPSNGIRRKYKYTATAAQTSFTNDDNGITVSYVDSLYVDVFQNGVKLAQEDYTSTTGTSVVLVQAASADDIIEIIVFDVFGVADTVSQSAGGNFAGDISSGGNPVKVAGKESMWVPAGAMYPNTTAGCSALTQVELSNGPELKVLDFAADADDFAQFTVAFPKSWKEDTDITFQPFWTVTAGTNEGTVSWELSAVAVSNDDTTNVAFGSAVSTTALAMVETRNDLMVSAESGDVEIAGSPAANDIVFFQINNDTGGSTQTGVVRLLGVKIFFTTDAANDA